MQKSKFVLCLLCVALLLTPCVLLGQDRGAITGNITDSAGAVVPGAPITVINTAKGVSLQSARSSSGDYYVADFLRHGPR